MSSSSILLGFPAFSIPHQLGSMPFPLQTFHLQTSRLQSVSHVITHLMVTQHSNLHEHSP